MFKGYKFSTLWKIQSEIDKISSFFNWIFQTRELQKSSADKKGVLFYTIAYEIIMWNTTFAIEVLCTYIQILRDILRIPKQGWRKRVGRVGSVGVRPHRFWQSRRRRRSADFRIFRPCAIPAKHPSLNLVKWNRFFTPIVCIVESKSKRSRKLLNNGQIQNYL